MPTTKSGQQTTTTSKSKSGHTNTTTTTTKRNIITTKRSSTLSTLSTASTAASRSRISTSTISPVVPTAPPRITFTRHSSSRTPSVVSNTSSRASSSTSSRTPLHTKDQNARTLMVSSRSSPSCISTSGSAAHAQSQQRRGKMTPAGGPAEGAAASSRPRQPQLAPRVTRGTPLTPKVAGVRGGATSQPVTPLARTPRVAGVAPSVKEDGATGTPLAPFIASNVTPRSGSRQSRAHESVVSTPSGTPVPERTSEGWSEGGPKLARSTTGSTAAPTTINDESKFFFASDAKSQVSTQQPQRPANTTTKTTPNFFYANGVSTSKSPPQQTTTSPNPLNPVYSNSTAAASEPTVTKFFYANGVPDAAPTRPSLPPSGSGSTVSSASRAQPLGRPLSGSNGPTLAQAPTLAPGFTSRPTSPIKLAQPPVGAVRNVSPPMQQPPTSAPRTGVSRRDSMESTASHRMVRGHSRQGSIPTMESVISASTPRLNAPHSPTSPAPSSISPLPSPGALQPALTMATIMQAVDAIDEEDSEDEHEDSQVTAEGVPDGLASPTKSVSNDPISDLVANARRERKVQDLEITNASLEAINRTLERQLRRQTAELRRYRRLSRAGRLSIASGAGGASSRAVSGTSTIGGLSDLTEDDDEDEEEEDGLLSPFEEDYDSELSSDNGDDGAPGGGGGTLLRRKRDEKRLQLDLSKHQELLIDSQKINQSLKRCLDWSEGMIKEGRKALEYNVRVSEVEVGGRVVVPKEEVEEEEEEEGGFIYDPRSAKEGDDEGVAEEA